MANIDLKFRSNQELCSLDDIDNKIGKKIIVMKVKCVLHVNYNTINQSQILQSIRKGGYLLEGT